jgi:hypothetical protein
MTLLEITESRLQAINYSIQLIRGGSTIEGTLNTLKNQKQLLESILEQYHNQVGNLK